MKKRICYSFALVFFLSAQLYVSAQTESAPKLETQIQTVGGEVRITELKSACKYRLTFNGKELWSSDCNADKNADFPILGIHTYNTDSFSYEGADVILLQQQMMGNACEGGDLLFLKIWRDGKFKLSDPIGFCGGKSPVVTWGDKQVTVVIPGGPPNRGKGLIPDEKWVYDDNGLKKVK